MKKAVITLVTLLSSFFMFSQEEETIKKESEFGFKAGAKLGYASLIQSNVVDLQGSVNAGEMQFFYRLPGGTSFSTGIDLLDFKANGVAEGEGYSLTHKYLRIPLYFNYSLSIFEKQFDDKVQAYAGIGLYANTLLKEEIQTIEETHKNKNLGWNGGIGFQLGMRFSVSDNLNFGVGLDTQSDFSDMKKNGVKRKLEAINTVNFAVEFKY